MFFNIYFKSHWKVASDEVVSLCKLHIQDSVKMSFQPVEAVDCSPVCTDSGYSGKLGHNIPDRAFTEWLVLFLGLYRTEKEIFMYHNEG